MNCVKLTSYSSDLSIIEKYSLRFNVVAPNKDINNSLDQQPAAKKQRTNNPPPVQGAGFGAGGGNPHFFYQDGGGQPPRPAGTTRPPNFSGNPQRNYQNPGNAYVPGKTTPIPSRSQASYRLSKANNLCPANNHPTGSNNPRANNLATVPNGTLPKIHTNKPLNAITSEWKRRLLPKQSEDPKIKAILEKCKITPKLLDYVAQFKFPYAHDVSCYEKLLKIGQGTFGEVFKARCRRTGQLVALKKILMENEKEGFPITALREIKMLQRLRHPHITDLKEICAEKAGKERFAFYLVFAFADHDLAGLLSSGQTKLKLVEIKTMMKHILEGLYRIHSSNILHRDMKAANVLISHDGVLKLADFGLARLAIRSGGHTPCYTNRVVTLWYRPPELLLGTRNYGPSIDIWGAGCIMAELWTRSPILQGETEQKQLILISNLCGSINPSTWTDCDKLPLYKSVELPQNLPRRIRERLKTYLQNEQALSLVDSMMTLNPEQRPSASQALDHHFFFEMPRPLENLKELLTKLPTNMFEYTAGCGAHANRGRSQAQHHRPAAGHMANRPSGSFNQQTHHHNRQQQPGGPRMGGQQR
uniref:Protein kinase domain-containing protein n=1 Tax=Ditylenchus dipsaci TaxID=166011 RepID=A0A915ELW4_9BILA